MLAFQRETTFVVSSLWSFPVTENFGNRARTWTFEKTRPSAMPSSLGENPAGKTFVRQLDRSTCRHSATIETAVNVSKGEFRKISEGRTYVIARTGPTIRGSVGKGLDGTP